MKIRGVLVLGMHRSGTSAVTRVVSELGLTPSRPAETVRGPWNPKGHFENQALMQLDDGLLGQMGCSWWHPPPAGDGYTTFAARIQTSPHQARRVFRGAYPRRDWVWKDPRACLLLPFWRRALADRVAGIVVLRNPLDVARSLERRNETTTAFGVALWERYNRLLVTHARGMPILVTRFDDLVADPVGWSTWVARFLGGLGLRVEQPDGAGLGHAVDPELRHSTNSRADLQEMCPQLMDLYDALDALVGEWVTFDPPELGPEPPSVQTELDSLPADTPPAWRPPPS